MGSRVNVASLLYVQGGKAGRNIWKMLGFLSATFQQLVVRIFAYLPSTCPPPVH